MVRFGIKTKNLTITTIDYQDRQAVRGMLRILESGSVATALFYLNDSIQTGEYWAILATGMRVARSVGTPVIVMGKIGDPGWHDSGLAGAINSSAPLAVTVDLCMYRHPAASTILIRYDRSPLASLYRKCTGGRLCSLTGRPHATGGARGMVAPHSRDRRPCLPTDFASSLAALVADGLGLATTSELVARA